MGSFLELTQKKKPAIKTGLSGALGALGKAVYDKMALTAISRQDAELLTWFFSEGLCAFERSTHGSLMGRATNGGHVECPECKGKRWVKVRVAECSACHDGYQYQAAKAKPRETDAGEPFAVIPRAPTKCTECDGRRVVELPAKSRRAGFTVDEICPRCTGLGVIGVDGHRMIRSGGIPAYPSGTEVRNPPPEPDDKALRWYGTVLRRLGHMLRERDVAVLYAYFGPGQAYERRQQLGRIWPVLVLTTQGRRLLKRYAKRRPAELPSIAEPYSAEYDFRKEWGDLTGPEQLEQLLGMPSNKIPESVWAAARKQANELFTSAVQAWNSATLRSETTMRRPPPKRRRRRNPPPECLLDVSAVRLTWTRKAMIDVSGWAA